MSSISTSILVRRFKAAAARLLGLAPVFAEELDCEVLTRSSISFQMPSQSAASSLAALTPTSIPESIFLMGSPMPIQPRARASPCQWRSRDTSLSALTSKLVSPPLVKNVNRVFAVRPAGFSKGAGSGERMSTAGVSPVMRTAPSAKEIRVSTE